MRELKQVRFLAGLAALVMFLSLLSCSVFATEPKETEAKPTEPTATTPTLTQPKPTEPNPAESKPTDPPATEPPTEAPTEPPTEAPTESEPEPIESDTVTEPEATEPEKEPRSMFQFAPDGQLTLVDDFEYTGMDADGNVMSKQFITVQARDGSYFYIIIDRTGETENVHFLNQVDLADLQSAASNGTQTMPVSQCICTSTCMAGHINMDCPVCSVNMTKCAAVDTVPPEEKQQETEQKTSKADDTPAQEPTEPSGPSYVKLGLGAAILIAIVVFFMKGNVFGSGKKAAPSREYDEYNDEYDEEEEPDEESEEASDPDDVEYEFVEEDEDAEEFEDDTELS